MFTLEYTGYTPTPVRLTVIIMFFAITESSGALQ